MKALILLTLVIFCSQAFAQDSKEQEAWKITRAKEAQGIDSLLGMNSSLAMPILEKYNPKILRDHSYPYIMQVLKIEHFNKWQHLATLYIFIDSESRVCKLNYFFTEKMPTEVARHLEDSMWWGLPKETYPPLDTNVIYEDQLPGRPQRHRGGIDNWFVISWQGHFLNRLFFQLKKPITRAIYSAAIWDFEKFAPRNGEILQDDIYEPILGTGK
jgi:hypothetical protein